MNDITMTNEELAEAITQAWSRCEQRYVGGSYTQNTEIGKEVIAHLKCLLAEQLKRAQSRVIAPSFANPNPFEKY